MRALSAGAQSVIFSCGIETTQNLKIIIMKGTTKLWGICLSMLFLADSTFNKPNLQSVFHTISK